MKKQDKKRDKIVVNALTSVCHIALEQVPHFQWITHFVNYQRFPESLRVVCVFDTEAARAQAQVAHHTEFLVSLITEKLREQSIQLKQPDQHIAFDSEEACDRDHGGDWVTRYR